MRNDGNLVEHGESRVVDHLCAFSYPCQETHSNVSLLKYKNKKIEKCLLKNFIILFITRPTLPFQVPFPKFKPQLLCYSKK